MSNLKATKIFGIIFLSLIFIISTPVIAEDKTEEIAKLQEKIINNSEKIMSAEANVTSSTQLLAALPEPKEKSAIAVFKIVDKTGERKATGSSVVSQGATDMLITALVRSRHFDVLDRVVDNNIMQEQDLQKNNLLASGDNPDANQLKGADYFITGAVTQYQVDKKTGGTGIKIAGLGGSSEYAIATTAIDLRLIDSTSGEVVWARSLKEKIKGKKVDLQAFSFMGNNIVELETGKGEQEVINMVLRTLIEEGVFEICQSNLE